MSSLLTSYRRVTLKWKFHSENQIEISTGDIRSYLKTGCTISQQAEVLFQFYYEPHRTNYHMTSWSQEIKIPYLTCPLRFTSVGRSSILLFSSTAILLWIELSGKSLLACAGEGMGPIIFMEGDITLQFLFNNEDQYLVQVQGRCIVKSGSIRSNAAFEIETQGDCYIHYFSNHSGRCAVEVRKGTTKFWLNNSMRSGLLIDASGQQRYRSSIDVFRFGMSGHAFYRFPCSGNKKLSVTRRLHSEIEMFDEDWQGPFNHQKALSSTTVGTRKVVLLQDPCEFSPVVEIQHSAKK